MTLAPHFAMEIHLHLAAAYPEEPWLEHFEWLEPMFNERLELREGRMWVPNRPGLGFSLSEQALAWTGMALLLVTHDLREAAYLATRICVMSARPGRILEDRAVPFERPRTLAMSYAPGVSALVQELRQCIADARTNADMAALADATPAPERNAA